MDGKLVIISAPSGAGKTTIVRQLLERDLKLAFSVSATTREPRGNEKDGSDYFFLTPDEFRRRIDRNEFVEWEEVYKDLYYGTLKSEIERIWSEGRHVLFDVDVKGGINLKKLYGEKAVSLFIMPPSVAELENRLRGRGTEKPDKIDMRLAKAVEEINLAGEFDRIVINDDLDEALAEVILLVTEFTGKN